ncbi:MAG: DUF3791 domain-containing protein [Treponema sp.]|nr:DUF3791 domain-containing protein [Treponema sp.]
MSTLSFKAYCIENYVEYKNASSSMIFNKFEKSGLLAHLDSDKEFLMQYFDRWFGEEE